MRSGSTKAQFKKWNKEKELERTPYSTPLTPFERSCVTKLVMIVSSRQKISIFDASKILQCEIKYIYDKRAFAPSVRVEEGFVIYIKTISAVNVPNYSYRVPKRQKRPRECARCGMTVPGGIRHAYGKRDEGDHTWDECTEAMINNITSG